VVNSCGNSLTVLSVAEVLQAHLEGTRGRTPWQWQPWMRRRVAAPAFACASTVERGTPRLVAMVTSPLAWTRSRRRWS